MTAWKHSGSITLEKNDQYWDKDAVKLKKINMVMINNNNTELKKFQAGELDWAGMPLGQLPTESLPTLKKTDLFTLNRSQACIGTNSTQKRNR